MRGCVLSPPGGVHRGLVRCNTAPPKAAPSVQLTVVEASRMQRKTYTIDKTGALVNKLSRTTASPPTGARCTDTVSTADTLVASMDDDLDGDTPPTSMQQAVSRVRGAKPSVWADPVLL